MIPVSNAENRYRALIPIEISHIKLQSSYRVNEFRLTPRSIRSAHIEAGGKFYMDTGPYPDREHHMHVHGTLYAGPTNHVYFVTGDKKVGGPEGSTRYTIRCFDMLNPSDICIPHPHLFGGFSTARGAGVGIKKLIKKDWYRWIDQVNEITEEYQSLLHLNEIEIRKARALGVGRYLTDECGYDAPSERFNMILNSII